MDFDSDRADDARVVRECEQEEQDYAEALKIIRGSTMLLPEKRHLAALHKELVRRIGMAERNPERSK